MKLSENFILATIIQRQSNTIWTVAEMNKYSFQNIIFLIKLFQGDFGVAL